MTATTLSGNTIGNLEREKYILVHLHINHVQHIFNHHKQCETRPKQESLHNIVW